MLKLPPNTDIAFVLQIPKLARKLGQKTTSEGQSIKGN